jgi:fructose-bisphosphate aldolase, class I
MSFTIQSLEKTIAELTVIGKGILAADESIGTIANHFNEINLACTEETRRDYRELLFSTDGLSDFISGVILFEETIKQKNSADIPLPQLLIAKGMVCGIKVDKGITSLSGSRGEKITHGLDGLAERLEEYKQLGARFAKWRAVITIGTETPTTQAIEANAQALARYAAICQEHGVVPIVEPEVLISGDHTLTTCARVTEEVLHAVFHALHQQHVMLEYMLLKPNMILPSNLYLKQVSPQEIALATITCLLRTVPAAVPSINFLSGGQSEIAATINLNAMNVNLKQLPWPLSFSYGRALQTSVLKAWHGELANRKLAQQILYQRAYLNSAAVKGNYTGAMENALANNFKLAAEDS